MNLVGGRGKKTVGLDGGAGDDDDVVTHIYDNDNIFSLTTRE